MSDSSLSTAFGDKRLEVRRAQILDGLVASGTSSIHRSFTKYSEQKACYRFLSNNKVTEQKLINRLRQKCRDQVGGKSVIALVDTSRICVDTYLGRITDYEGIGILSKNQCKGSYGFMIHPIYVVDAETGHPYGLADVKLINRPMQDSPLTKQEKKHKMWKSPIEDKESYKWIGPLLCAQGDTLKDTNHITYVMDREADIWEVYDRIPTNGVDVVVRSKENRVIKDMDGKGIKLHSAISKHACLAMYKIKLPRKKGRRQSIKVSLKASQCLMGRTRNRVKTKALAMSYIEVKEVCKGSKNKALRWILWTNKKVTTAQQAKEIVDIYVKRWQIEIFFKLLKTDGYQIEKCQ